MAGHMLKAFAAPQHRRETFVFLATSCLAAIAALVVGLDGNTPANVLAFVAGAALVLAFVHPWRRAREFKYLFYAAGLSFAFFVVLHNLLDARAATLTDVAPLEAILQGLSVVAFFAAVVVCPAAFVIGLGGMLVMFLGGHKGDQSEPAA